MSKHTQRGFTLIELLVVISIVGLLASIVFASLGVARSKARDVARRQTLRELTTALEFYANDHGGYPATNWINSGSGANWFPALLPYMPTLPRDPEENKICTGDSNEKYTYAYISDGTNYKLVACADIQVPANDPMWDAQRPGIVLMLCADPTNAAFCGLGI